MTPRPLPARLALPPALPADICLPGEQAVSVIGGHHTFSARLLDTAPERSITGPSTSTFQRGRAS